VVVSCLAEGRGIAQNLKLALQHFSQAGEKGMADGWIRAGLLLEQGGKNLAQNVARAKECYEKAAAQANARASAYLGLLYEQGKGMAKDLEKAKECYRKAAQADQYGLIKLAQLLKTEGQTPQNVQEAMGWMAHATRMGWREAYAALQLLMPGMG
jgi:TPR repeat protein